MKHIDPIDMVPLVIFLCAALAIIILAIGFAVSWVIHGLPK